MYGTPFEIFGVVHLLTIAIVILVSALLPKFYQKKSDGQKLIMTRMLAHMAPPLKLLVHIAYQTALTSF